MSSLLNEKPQPWATYRQGQAPRNAQWARTWPHATVAAGPTPGQHSRHAPSHHRHGSSWLQNHAGEPTTSRAVGTFQLHHNLTRPLFNWSAVDENVLTWCVTMYVHTEIDMYVWFKIVSFVAKYCCKTSLGPNVKKKKNKPKTRSLCQEPSHEKRKQKTHQTSVWKMEVRTSVVIQHLPRN